MLLVVSHSRDETANYLCAKLQGVRLQLARLDTDTCARRVQVAYHDDAVTLVIDGTPIKSNAVTHVWLRRPKPVEVQVEGDAAEQVHVANEWGEAIEGFLAHVPMERWMNHPVTNVLASHKMEQLTRAREAGLTPPRSMVTQDPAELRAFWLASRGQVVAKPLASGFLERDGGDHTSIYTSRVRESDLQDAEALRMCPTLFQEEIQKSFDVRVTWVDGRMRAVALDRRDTAEPDVRRCNMTSVTYRPIAPPYGVEVALERLLRSYHLRFAAVDFGVTAEGDWVFFEVNPNGQWAWLDLVGGTTLWEDFADAFAP